MKEEEKEQKSLLNAIQFASTYEIYMTEEEQKSISNAMRFASTFEKIQYCKWYIFNPEKIKLLIKYIHEDGMNWKYAFHKIK